MNKKFIIGFASVVAVSSFWACGDGTINEMDDRDVVMKNMYVDDAESGKLKQALMEAALDSCREDPVCEAQYRDFLLDPEGFSSAEIPIESSAGGTPGISSSATYTIPSSSSITIAGRSSSSIGNFSPTSSSSGPGSTPVTGLGSCAPEPNPISKGGATKWTFKPNGAAEGYSVMDFAKATYTWNFGADATDDGSGTGTNSGNISYASSGVHEASVVVTMNDLKSETVPCSPLQVNGDPITCTCTADGGDVTTDAGVATWTATCTSASEINNYSWDGTDGVATTFTHTFAAKGDTYTPVLKVGNVDNTLITADCPTVTATDASQPDYVVDGTADGTYENIGPGIYTMVYACKTDQYYQTPLLVKAPNGAVTGTVEGKAFSVVQYGQEGVYSSQTANTSITIEITSGSATIACQ